MQVILAIIGVFGAAGIIILLSTIDTGGGIKAAIIIPVVLIAVYGLARIKPKETKSEKDTGQ